MTEERRKKGQKGKGGIDVEFGSNSQFSLGGIFKGIENFIDLASKLSEQSGEIKEQGEIKLGKEIKGMYGFNIRTMAGGTPKVETFGNIKKTPKGPVVEEEREPVVDVFDEKDHVLIVTELPGVSENDINLELKGDILMLSAETGDRKYSKEILLSSKVREDKIESSYKNGILEIKLIKTTKKSNKS
jgi:HSP20 family protein